MRERAVWLITEIGDQHDLDWAAMTEVARLLGVGSPETVRRVGPPGRGRYWSAARQPGITTDALEELKRLKQENAELKRANGILEAAR